MSKITQTIDPISGRTIEAQPVIIMPPGGEALASTKSSAQVVDAETQKEVEPRALVFVGARQPVIADETGVLQRPDGRRLGGGVDVLYNRSMLVQIAGQSNGAIDQTYRLMHSFVLNNPDGDLFRLGDRLDFKAFFGHANSTVGKNFRLYCDGQQLVGTTAVTTQMRTECDYQIWLSPDGFVADGTGNNSQGPFDASAIVLGKSSYTFEVFAAFGASSGTTEQIQLRGVSLTRNRTAGV